jgi:phenylacetate-CoA ligase
MTHYTGIATEEPEAFMAALNDLRFAKLRRQIAYCHANSEYYRAKLAEAGVNDPADVRSLDDFRSLPALITKAEHRAIQEESLERFGHPYGMHLCAPVEKVVHIAGTSGTTGHPTFYTWTKKDLDINHKVFGRMWALIGIKPGDSVFQANGLSLWLAGITVIMALEDYGARPIPVGAEAGVARILRYIQLTRPVALMCTPSLAGHLIERAPEEIGCDVGTLGIKKVIIGGEPGGGIPAVRERLMNAYGATVHDIAGGAWHNGLISGLSHDYHGMHMMGEDYCFRYDLRDPETKRPLPLVDGAVGEAIHTGLEYEAGPALRYATGDIVRIHVGRCPGDGIFGTRMQIIGRVDDLLIVKGVKVYPASLKEVLEGFQPDVSGEMRIELDRAPPRVEPPLQLTVEAAADLREADRAALATRIAERMHQLLAVRPQISIVAFGALPRSSLKTKLIHVREDTAA